MASFISQSHPPIPLFFFSTPKKSPLIPFSRSIAQKVVLSLSPLEARKARWRVWERRDGIRKGEDNPDLEAEIYEFMQNSSRPEDFPTRAELIAAGRRDLAEAVAAQGGWLVYGWDLDREPADSDFGGEDWRPESRMERAVHPDYPERFDFGVHPDYPEASSSGQPMEEEASIKEGGIEGILSRLEKERSWSYANGTKGKRGNGRNSRDKAELDPGDKVLLAHRGKVDGTGKKSKDTLTQFQEDHFHSNNKNRILHSQNGSTRADNSLNNLSGDSWRSWSYSRAGVHRNDFEAAEIVPHSLTYNKKELEQSKLSDYSDNISLASSTDGNGSGRTEPYQERQEINKRLRHLEMNLSSSLDSLRSRVSNVLSYELDESSATELDSLSDDWEFRETEIMNAQDDLRSLRARMAVLEGKMALKIIELQKIIEENQRRLDAAERALDLLRTVSLVWPNPASDVLLAGSFDGWTSQRRMERSKEGIFSLNLKLYPGQYEIKFIVDGIWKVDPLRPIVNNNGHENNILTVH